MAKTARAKEGFAIDCFSAVLALYSASFMIIPPKLLCKMLVNCSSSVACESLWPRSRRGIECRIWLRDLRLERDHGRSLRPCALVQRQFSAPHRASTTHPGPNPYKARQRALRLDHAAQPVQSRDVAAFHAKTCGPNHDGDF